MSQEMGPNAAQLLCEALQTAVEGFQARREELDSQYLSECQQRLG
jgi:hypothetical protein